MSRTIAGKPVLARGRCGGMGVQRAATARAAGVSCLVGVSLTDALTNATVAIPIAPDSLFAPLQLHSHRVRAFDYSRVVAQGGLKHPPWRSHGQATSGSIPNRSFTATRSFCLHPR